MIITLCILGWLLCGFIAAFIGLKLDPSLEDDIGPILLGVAFVGGAISVAMLLAVYLFYLLGIGIGYVISNLCWRIL